MRSVSTLLVIVLFALFVGLVIGGAMHVANEAAKHGPRPIVSPDWRQSNIKEFRAQLDLFHPDDQFNTTAVDLEDGVEKLIRSGLDPDEAFRSILIVVQSRQINPAKAYEIADLGRRIAAVKRGAITR
jgi:hypothetical protein